MLLCIFACLSYFTLFSAFNQVRIPERTLLHIEKDHLRVRAKLKRSETLLQHLGNLVHGMCIGFPVLLFIGRLGVYYFSFLILRFFVTRLFCNMTFGKARPRVLLLIILVIIHRWRKSIRLVDANNFSHCRYLALHGHLIYVSPLLLESQKGYVKEGLRRMKA